MRWAVWIVAAALVAGAGAAQAQETPTEAANKALAIAFYQKLLNDKDGPAAAATYQLVLASPDLAPAIDAQRVKPDDLATESVTYYLQSTETIASGTLRSGARPNHGVRKTSGLSTGPKASPSPSGPAS